MSYSEKQIQIMNTAEKLFASRGYDGTSIRDIAEEAKVNTAMISYYFGSKEKLMQALFQERTDSLKSKVESLLSDENLTPIEKMCILIDDYIVSVVQKHRFFKIMLHEQMLEKNHEITNMLNEMKKQNAEVIEKIIKDGQKKKAFKKNINVVFMLNTMIGTVMHTLVNQEYYKIYYKLESLPENEFQALLQKNLSNHIKSLFKAILSYEA